MGWESIKRAWGDGDAQKVGGDGWWEAEEEVAEEKMHRDGREREPWF
jgi:hypothetical protein